MQKNQIRAQDLFLWAALRGNYVAQFELAKRYETRIGVQKSLVDAHVWYSLASSNKTYELEAKSRIIEIDRHFSDAQRAEASVRRDLLVKKIVSTRK